MKILFCNVGWMRDYNGIKGDSIERGGSYNKDSTGHEVCNFSSIRSKVFGYVQPTGQIKIEKLGADKTASFVSGVTVVWTAGPETGGTAVIGWYKNATVYRDYQELENRTKIQKDNELTNYRVEAKAKDVTLLLPEERTLLIPRAVKGGIGQSNVWYADAPESKVHVKKVLTLIDKGFSKELPDVDRFMASKEGNPRLVAHLKRERNQTIVKEKKKQALDNTGKVSCEVCSFDFYSVFGAIGEGFCEVHHLQPLSKSDGEVNTTLEDLAIVCSNCHRILHRQNPMLTIERLKKVISKNNT
ncbi:MAG: HNH endonuclease [Candidatus Electrothrix communis]|nr:MAG: HNH endonuclease [Candidatus Electrothrix communis]